MAEYTSLGDYFKAIGDAIREKKGTSDKIKPINFPEEIESIEVGSGSGGLGTGTYERLSVAKPTPVNHITSCHFTYRGEMYFIGRGSSYLMIYKYENDKYTLVYTSTIPWGGQFLYAIEFDDKVYFYHQGYYKLAVWDGNTLELLPDIPIKASKNILAVYNDKLYIVDYYSSSIINLYKFDKDTSTIILEKEISFSYSNYDSVCFSHNNELYFITYNSSNKCDCLYKYDGSAFNLISLLSSSYTNKCWCYNKLYYWYNNALNSYDFITGEIVEVTQVPYVTKEVILYNNTFHTICYVDNKLYTMHYIINGV